MDLMDFLYDWKFFKGEKERGEEDTLFAPLTVSAVAGSVTSEENAIFRRVDDQQK